MLISFGWFVTFVIVGIVGSIGTLLFVLGYFLKEWRAGNLW